MNDFYEKLLGLTSTVTRETPRLLPEGMSARARATDPETSHMAASSAGTMDNTRHAIVAALSDAQDGLTSKEISLLTGIDYVTISPSMKPLADQGIIRRTGRRRQNPGSKQKAIVWEYPSMTSLP